MAKRKNDALFTSNNDSWETPWELYNLLDNLFHFELDAAATKENAKCKTYYTMQDNGLFQLWKKSSFCNPPFSNVEQWVKKAWQESKRGNTCVILIPARIETDYYFDYVWPYKTGADAVIAIPNRIQFTFRGIKAGTSPFPTAIICFNIGAIELEYKNIRNHFEGLARCLDLQADDKFEKMTKEMRAMKERIDVLETGAKIV